MIEVISYFIKYYFLLVLVLNGLGWVYIVVGFVLLFSVGGWFIKGYCGSSGEVLFDGGSFGMFFIYRVLFMFSFCCVYCLLLIE